MRVLAHIAFSFAAACALFVYVLPWPVSYLPAVIAIAAAAVLFAFRRAWLRRMALIAFGLALGFAWCALFWSIVYQPAIDVDGSQMQLEAVVCDLPHKTKYGQAVTVRALLDGRSIKTVLYLDAEVPELAPGDAVSVPARVRLSADIPARDSDSAYYNAKGVFLTASQAGECVVSRPEHIPLYCRPAMLLASIKTRIAACFAADTAPFMTALITGDRSGLSDADYAAIKVSGVSHVISVSGMHVSCLMGFLLALVRGRRKLAALIGIPVVVVFAAVVGGAPGAVRAAILYAFTLAAPVLGRESDSPTSLGAALLSMLIANPWAIANIGLQLSFAATAGILLLYGKLFYWVQRSKPMQKLRTKHRRMYSVLCSVWSVAATTLSALVFTVPLTAYWFGTASLIALISNLLIVPLISVCFVPGLAAAIIGGTAGSVLGWLVNWPVRWVLLVARIAAKAPYTQLSTSSPYVVIWLLFAYAVLLLVLFFQPLRRRPLLPVCCVALPLSIVLLFTSLEFSTPEFSLAMLDVGQGQCIVLTGGMTAVVDCGGSYDALASDQLVQRLSGAGQASLDALVITHYDSDHAGGAPMLLRQIAVDTVYLPDPREDAALHDQIVQAAQDTGASVQYVTLDLRLSSDGGSMTIFAPVGTENDNESGLSVLFSAADTSALITGDIGIEQENKLLLDHAIPELDLLVAGHHGSKYSTGESLLAITNPQLVLISVGENSYGHPALETLSRIAQAGAAVCRTDLNGTITVRR